MSEAPPRSSGDVREKLLRSAGRLIAERGLEGVSFREISREAGQRNATALQYHFGDRERMLRALMQLHAERVAVRRQTLLDHYRGRADLTLREVATVLISPLIPELATSEGADFLQVAALLVNRSDRLVDPGDALGALIHDQHTTLTQWSELVGPLMPEGTVGAPLHRRFAAMRFTHIEFGRRARVAPQAPAALFAAQLTDMVTALLRAEPSAETRQLLLDHAASKQATST